MTHEERRLLVLMSRVLAREVLTPDHPEATRINHLAAKVQKTFNAPHQLACGEKRRVSK
ncbi:MAG: hypothetical protein M3Y07_05430 [Acidobacteriota bacterium]|nr:hypothetical protein [Acidobacteriota bacterium]